MSRILVALLALTCTTALASDFRGPERPRIVDTVPSRPGIPAMQSDQPSARNTEPGGQEDEHLMSITQPVSLEDLAVRNRVDPLFPREERKMKRADCTMRVFIDNRGIPLRAVPMECDARFADASEDALMQWRFEPYRVDGKARPVRTDVLVEYRR